MHGTWRSFLSHLECTACGLRHDADQLQTVCTACGKVLFARYDLDGVRQAVSPTDFATRRWDMWRYWELLPVRDEANVVSLGEGLTPLVGVPRRRRRGTGPGARRGPAQRRRPESDGQLQSPRPVRGRVSGARARSARALRCRARATPAPRRPRTRPRRAWSATWPCRATCRS